MTNQTRERRFSRGMIIVALLALLVIVAGIVPSPYVILRPGPVVNTLGEVDDDGAEVPVIALHGVESYPATGELNLLTMTTVGSPERPVSWLGLVRPLFDPRQEIFPQSDIYAPEVSQEERESVSQAQMNFSQELAAAAALTALGEEVPTELTVARLVPESPADGVVAVGDRILEVAGTEVTSVQQIRDLVHDSGAESPISLTLERDGKTLDVSLTPRRPAPGEDPAVGVIIETTYDLPFEVDMTVVDIGGPSAGLMFALGAYDLLTEGDLVGDLSVSGTGTITADGDVGPIGGLPQKIWGAEAAGSDLFLMPTANCADLPEQLPADMAFAAVDTMQEAIAAIESVAAGADSAGLPQCDPPE